MQKYAIVSIYGEFIMIVLILLCIALAISAILYIILKLRNIKYKDFILKSSIALNQLLEINDKYHFYECNNYDDSHVYDNNVFYNNISCEDYLIYQLQFKKYEVSKDIKNIDNNIVLYKAYCKEIDVIDSFGNFTNSTEKLNLKYLFSLEKKVFNQYKLKPILHFHITITLYCSKINGQIYASKHQTFDSEQIIPLIKKLNNKNGSFYNDKDIWDSLCRVERGKVSNKMRFSIYKRDGYRCRICGRSERSDYLEIDHIKPIAKGGKTTYDNLQTLCRRCNKEKGDTY